MESVTPLGERDRLQADFPVCTIAMSVAELAARLGVPLLQWQEPGMGAASGFACRLGAGAKVFLEEFEHLRAQTGAGPTIYVEAAGLVERGVAATVTSTLAALGLTRDCVTWVQPEDAVHAARQVLEAVLARDRRQNGEAQ